jgi:hypothetical protein
MTWACRSIVAASLVVGLACPSWAGQVKLEIRDGLVTLDAKDSSLREILAEWARVGQTRVVNAESVQNAPMTVQLTGVPELQALETLLRSAAGFVAAPRAVMQASASVFDRILLMPGMRPAGVPTAAAPTPARAAQQPAAMRDRQVMPQPAVIDEPDDDPQPTVQMAPPGASTGALQPGMPTAPASPNNGPYGSPYGNPNTPNVTANPYAQGANPTATPPTPPMPQSASRPGVPTAPIKPPDKTGEIK